MTRRTCHCRSRRPRSWPSRSNRYANASSGSRTDSSTGSERPRTRCSSEFSERLGEAYDAEDLLPRMARILAEGTGAQRSDVWLAVGGRLRPEASWPDGRRAPFPDALSIDRSRRDSVPVRHQDELLGALSLEKRPGESLTATEGSLVEHLAGQAGLVLRNVRLTEALLERLEELQASRQRLVAAQDEERRKLERNLHDGAQQQLVALSVKARPGTAARRARSREGRGDARTDPGRYERRPGEPARPRAWDLPATPRGPGPRRSARGSGSQGSGPDHRGRRGHRTVRPRRRGRGLLQLPRGAAERGQVRGGHASHHRALERRWHRSGSP